MDKLKQYIRENEHRLNIEQVGEGVWTNIDTSLEKKYKKSLPVNKYSLVQWLRHYAFANPRWAFAFVIMGLLIISFAWRTKHVATIGSLITFNMEEVRVEAIQKIQSLESVLSLDLHTTKNKQLGILSFVGFLKNEDTSKLNVAGNEISDLGGQAFSIIPVGTVVSESLFSRFMYTVFNTHVDVKRTNEDEISKNIIAALKSRGIENITVQLKGDDITINAIAVPPTRAIAVPIPADPVKGINTSPETSKDSVEKKPPASNDISRIITGELKELEWILHTWRTTDSSVNTYHRWIKINDTLFRSFLLRLEPNSNIYPGYFLYVKNGNTVLAIDNNKWTLQQRAGSKFTFQREQDIFPQKVVWELKNGKWWFARIRNTLKDEIYLYTDDSKNRQLDNILDAWRKKNPLQFQ